MQEYERNAVKGSRLGNVVRASWSFLALLLLPAWFFSACNEPAPAPDGLFEQVLELNYRNRYDSTIHVLSDFLARERRDSVSMVKAYIAFSNTYKKIRNYDKAALYLSKAESVVPHGEKGKEVGTLLGFEQALVYFDIRDYEQAAKVMNGIRQDLAELDSVSIAQFKMQDAYFAFMDKEYGKALRAYDNCIAILKDAAPRHLPMIYPKKMEVYLEMDDWKNLIAAKDSSLLYARTYDVPAYSLYTYEVLKTCYQRKEAWKDAYSVEDSCRIFREGMDVMAHNDAMAAAELDAKIKTINQQKVIQRQYQGILVLIGIIFFGLAIFMWYLASSLKATKEQREKLKKADDTNRRIISTISHDIKDPLLGISLMLRNCKKGEVPKEEDIRSLRAQVDNTSDALSNLVAWSKNRLGNQEGGSVPTKEVVELVMSDLSVFKERKKLSFSLDIDEGASLYLEPHSARIVVRNLLSNAVKFSPGGGNIKIEAKEDWLRIRDYGKGVHPRQKDKLLKDIVEPGLGTSMEVGSGMGLYITASIVREQGYDIVSENVEKGASFLVFLKK